MAPGVSASPASSGFMPSTRWRYSARKNIVAGNAPPPGRTARWPPRPAAHGKHPAVDRLRRPSLDHDEEDGRRRRQPETAQRSRGREAVLLPQDHGSDESRGTDGHRDRAGQVQPTADVSCRQAGQRPHRGEQQERAQRHVDEEHHRQLSRPVSRPPITPPSAPPAAAAAVSRLSALALARGSEKPVVTRLSVVGTSTAPPTPWTNRAATTCQPSCASPAARLAAAKRTGRPGTRACVRTGHRPGRRAAGSRRR